MMIECQSQIKEDCDNCLERENCQVKGIVRLIKNFYKNKFHGNLIIPFKDGKIGKVKKEEFIDIIETEKGC